MTYLWADSNAVRAAGDNTRGLRNRPRLEEIRGSDFESEANPPLLLVLAARLSALAQTHPSKVTEAESV